MATDWKIRHEKCAKRGGGRGGRQRGGRGASPAHAAAHSPPFDAPPAVL